jgi:hypothetical protein
MAQSRRMTNLFEQPELSSPEQLQRRDRTAARLLVRFVVLAVAAIVTPRRAWAFVAVPVFLLLIFGPVMIGQRLGKRR